MTENLSQAWQQRKINTYNESVNKLMAFWTIKMNSRNKQKQIK